ncbi:MAG: glutathione S-transferase [Rhodobacteraceae bacterium]|nr:glutathione S-transferase [Paracoccaceae bacterium]
MITLFHSHQTRSMRVLWLLYELKCDFKVVVQPFDKTMCGEEFLSRNPAGRVPALDLDGQRVWESGAMIELLCERFPAASLGRAPGDPGRADWLIWLHFAETISQHSAALTQQHIALRDDHMRSPIVMKLEAARIGKCYAALEGQLADSDYLAGGFSAADIAVGQAVYMARHFARLDDFACVTHWYERLTARPAFQMSLPPEGAKRLYNKDFYPAWDVPDHG